MPYSTPKFDYHFFDTPCVIISFEPTKILAVNFVRGNFSANISAALVHTVKNFRIFTGNLTVNVYSTDTVL